MIFHKFLISVSTLFALVVLSACDVVLPPTHALEPQTLTQTDYAWKNIDLRDYYFIGVTRIDCPMVLSYLTGSGICKPAKTPVGSAVNCPLSFPYETLQVGCLMADDVPAVYVTLTAKKEARDIVLSQRIGRCQYAAAGPAVGESPRYQTDRGYKVCLFEGSDKISSGRLSSQDESARPIGLYLDFSQTPMADVETMAEADKFNGPFTITLDARYFENDERERAFKTIFELFKIYQDSGEESGGEGED